MADAAHGPGRRRSRGRGLALAMALMSAAVGIVTSRAAIAEGEPKAAQGTAIVTHRPLGAGRTESVDPVVTYIVRFADGLDAASGASALRDAGVDVYDTFDEVFAGAIVGASPDLAAALGADPRIAAIEPDRVVTTSDGGPASHVEALQPAAPWGLDRLDDGPADGTYEYRYTGAGVTAYVLDSGVFAGHTDFGGRVSQGAYLMRFGAPGDCNGHGTHVAGILGSTTYGVAKGVTIFPLRIFDCDGAATASDVIGGLNFIVGHHQPGQPAVLNLSV